MTRTGFDGRSTEASGISLTHRDLPRILAAAAAAAAAARAAGAVCVRWFLATDRPAVAEELRRGPWADRMVVHDGTIGPTWRLTSPLTSHLTSHLTTAP